MADQVPLGSIEEFLAEKPWIVSFVPGVPENVRAIDFPRSAREPSGRLRILYEIVEDDREVRLLGIERVTD